MSHQLELFRLKNNRHSVVMGHLPSDNCKVISLSLMLGGSMLTRRRIFVGGVASVMCAPAIVRAESLMPIRALIVPMQRIHAGFVERLRFHCMEQVLKNGWTTERARTFRKRGATSSHLCPNARVAGVNPLAWRPGFFADQNSYACALGTKLPI